MTAQPEDPAYRILVEAARETGQNIESLLLDLYAIQKEHQFEKDRSLSTSQMEARILAEVDRDGGAKK